METTVGFDFNVERLGEAATEAYIEFETAKDLGDWRRGLDAALFHVRLRALSLALARGIVVPDETWKGDANIWPAFDDAVASFLAREGFDCSPESNDFAARMIEEALDAATALEHELFAEGGGRSPDPGEVALAALQLGGDALILELIANGHYTEVARLRERKIGRVSGWSKTWNTRFAEHLQPWWEINAHAGMADLIREALRFREEEYPATKDGKHFEKVPDTEGGMRAALKLTIEREQLNPPSQSSK